MSRRRGSIRAIRNRRTLPCLAIQLGRTKTGDADEEGRVLLVGPPVEALREWLERADIKKGPIFRAIDRWEAVEEKALTPQSINLIVKRRCAMVGVEPEAFSAHGLRAGYLTEAARQGIGLPEAMQQSQHRSVQQAASYYNEAERAQDRAARFYDAANGMTVRAVLPADNIVPLETLSADNMEGSKRFQFGAMALALTPH